MHHRDGDCIGRLGGGGFGAALLFITNAVTIAAAAIGLFFAMGFSPRRREGEGLIPRSLVVTGMLTAILLAPLGYQSYQFVQQAQWAATIREVVNDEINNLVDAELVSVIPREVGDILEIEITIRTLNTLNYEDSVALRAAIDVQLQQPIELSINQIFAARLDPRIPPTQTQTNVVLATVTVTSTSTSTAMPMPPLLRQLQRPPRHRPKRYYQTPLISNRSLCVNRPTDRRLAIWNAIQCLLFFMVMRS